MNIDKLLEGKQKQLEVLGREIAQLRKILQEKQIEAVKLDGAISALKELNTPPEKK